MLARPPTAQDGSVICNMRRKICSLRPSRDVELVEELAQEFGALDGCKAAGGAANLHAGGWAD